MLDYIYIIIIILLLHCTSFHLISISMILLFRALVLNLFIHGTKIGGLALVFVCHVCYDQCHKSSGWCWLICIYFRLWHIFVSLATTLISFDCNFVNCESLCDLFTRVPISITFMSTLICVLSPHIGVLHFPLITGLPVSLFCIWFTDLYLATQPDVDVCGNRFHTHQRLKN